MKPLSTCQKCVNHISLFVSIPIPNVKYQFDCCCCCCCIYSLLCCVFSCVYAGRCNLLDKWMRHLRTIEMNQQKVNLFCLLKQHQSSFTTFVPLNLMFELIILMWFFMRYKTLYSILLGWFSTFKHGKYSTVCDGITQIAMSAELCRNASKNELLWR